MPGICDIWSNGWWLHGSKFSKPRDMCTVYSIYILYYTVIYSFIDSRYRWSSIHNFNWSASVLRLLGTPGGCPAVPHDSPVMTGSLGYFYGIPMGFLLDSCGISKVFPWCFYDISMGLLWEFLWGFFVAPMLFLLFLSMIFLWDFYDISMGLLWDFHVIGNQPTRKWP